MEGEALAHEREPEGPVREFAGYASFRSTQDVFVAKRMRMRQDAICTASPWAVELGRPRKQYGARRGLSRWRTAHGSASLSLSC
jgi:UbiD family decarboxylase